jgi:DNA (cytosine-5)-methyltransferase 1
MHKFTAISLFTGAGGLDLGFEAGKFTTKVAVEMDADAVATIRHNRDWAVIPDDVHSDAASSAQILKKAKLREGDADILIGGPPCQPFSKSGFWVRGEALRLADPRAGTLGAYLRVLRDTKPKTFLLENVPGIAYNSMDEGLVFLRREIEEINKTAGCNYSFNSQLLKAVEFGVPQDRQRVFVIGHREGRQFRFPDPTHCAESVVHKNHTDLFGLEAEKRAPLTAWDAIGDLQDDDDSNLQVTGKWADLLPSIPEGANYLFHTDRGEGLPLFGWRRRYWNFLLKLSKQLPSWTIAAQPGPAIGPFHWRNRRLSMRELCRLQTFPEDYQVLGSLRAVQKQVGNAVPSALAERLAIEIRSQLLGDLLGDKPTNSVELSLIPKRRKGIPSTDFVGLVPKKYQHLVGAHDAHPGTGKGYAALRRETA